MTAKCEICPRGCRLGEGEVGACRARQGREGRVVAMAYGRPCAVAVDPMEKKPLYHFLPGRPVLSLGMAGCNLRCRNCQNADISQRSPEEIPAYRLSPDEVVALAVKEHLPAIAYTYTEPLVAFEYVLDCAKAARAAGVANVLVSAGYVNPGPLEELLPFVDAANIDLKTMDPEGYRENCGVELAPVLATLKAMARTSTVLEVTNLVIPGFNDSDALLEAWCGFVAEELGVDIPVHFSRFFPCHRLTDRPATPVGTLARAKAIARKHGLRYVYAGNVQEEETTACPACGAVLVERRGFDVGTNRLRDGRCFACGQVIYGRF
ncbi:MAG: AmmeMemoRadiSam system radical SAM enzyme [Kiritimatiellae bacterium]|nr:AmmeMemoRadiSam system radical SAM enzyme [Kiritimatiellia bacterium]